MNTFARLSASESKADQEDYEAGRLAAREWVEVCLDCVEESGELVVESDLARQLRNLARKFDELSASFHNPRRIAEVMDPSRTTEEVWSCALGDDWETLVNEPMFLRGFCETAVEIWKEHKCKQQ